MKRSPMKRKPMKRKPAKGAAEWEIRKSAHLKNYPFCALRPLTKEQERGPCWGPIDVHHIQSRGMGGTSEDTSPLVTLCRVHHDWVHGHPDEAKKLGLMARRGDGE